MGFGTKKEKIFADITSKVCYAEGSKFSLNEGDRFECDLFEKSYLDKESLVKHIRWKHGPKKPRIKCKVCMCNVEFGYNSTLVRHMKKFHCDKVDE